MTDKQITADKITKPIQLLAAWLVGLLTIDASFLITATKFDTNSWQSEALVIAAIFNVPIFLCALFLLQTKFRPELQEDSFYSSYLNNKLNDPIKVNKTEIIFEELQAKVNRLEASLIINHHYSEDDGLTELFVGVNSHLGNIEQIAKLLSDNGINLYREFSGDKPPKNMTVGISDKIPEELLIKIFEMSLNAGFKHYCLIEPWEEIKEDVLFGVYVSSQDQKNIPTFKHITKT